MKLPTTISSCHELILKQQALIEQLLGRVGELEEQVKKNSRNSHKPPSSDGLQKQPAFPRKSGKKRGGQRGHKGKTLELVSSPDETVQLLPDTCTCGAVLDKAQAEVVERRQVFDLPQPKLEITEYQRLGWTCKACGTSNVGKFPDEIVAPTQYGEGVRALTTLLNSGFAMPVKKVQRLFTDLFGYAINEGTIQSNNHRCSQLLMPTEEQIKQRLTESSVGHSDETGVRVAGKLHWLHVFSTSLYTFFFVHSHRGKKALQDTMSILPSFSGWVVHDCWSSYFSFTGFKHALCGAHLLRELHALVQNNVVWASWFRRYLLTLFYLTQQNDGGLTAAQQHKALLLFEKIAAAAHEIEPLPQKQEGKKGRPKATKGRNLLNRLVKHQKAVLAFAFHQEVPFTNNLAERDLRPAKTKQKVSGCFRTFKGAQTHARINSFISTVRKQQLNIFNELKKVFEGKTFSFHSSEC